MRTRIGGYQYINILSLDVVAGAVIGAAFFCRLFDVAAPWLVYLSLALTVWAIYTLDHLRDARSIPGVAATDRHRFHQEHFKTILWVLVIVCALNAVVVGLLRDSILKPGLALGAVVCLYLVLQRYLKFMKEFFVAAIYTAGILLPLYAFGAPKPEGVHLLIIVKYFITALMNLLLFSLFDRERDETQRQHSFVTWFGPRSTRRGIALLGVLNIIAGFRLWTFEPVIAAIFVIMNLSLLGILVFRRQLMRRNRYRLLGDGVFLLPALYLF